MSLVDLLWIFLLLSAIQPAVQRWMLQRARIALLQRLERRRGSRAITLIHRQETMSLLGFPIVRYIDINDSEEVLRAIRLTPPEMPIDLLLHTPGGLVLAAEQIARALREHKGKVTVFVPHYAMSGGSLIAMAADEIVMDPHAVLGPIDPQLGQFPAASILTVLQRKPIQEVDDQTIILADIAEKAQRQVRSVVQDLLGDKMGAEEAARLAEVLTQGTWTHDYPITVQEVRALGLPVSTDMPEEVYRLMDLFPQAAQRRPSVEYIPVPYRGTEPPPAPRPRVPQR
ncbi:MAG: ATP-dependent Clp protease proteolytic subunit [Armatimonadota bacterium]|nr:ATP-dependent Clp protease proteolytic subunit [Armatimonadota bacterium]MDR7449117.1 ATP-dependent Clp protease proteolytic subunit [Armatimonadota bacterium]MDR7459195.1 ATP-dependent Clp protease proteolytic subunit [Armatimonadota bacterium]MDR7480467.1 ATP-dependent Clp protease proteolytic subunit [Armatimonadota bacterium]MDR7489205.1 ATP-dependent Clp protease proteolytic subunit [Armatimonadota bacterium]